MRTFFTALTSYFVIIDPIGVSMIFAALTTGKNNAYARKMALMATGLSLVIVFLFGFFGAWLLEELGIAIDAFKIAGGLLLFYTAFCMVIRPDDYPSRGVDEAKDIFVYPLTIPLIAGPGCLTLTILLFSKAKESVADLLSLSLSIFLIYSLTFIAFLLSSAISRIFGRVGGDVLKRILGVLLAALSIQYIASGIKGFLQ
jgi:multiple antibiotic resistance protein